MSQSSTIPSLNPPPESPLNVSLNRFEKLFQSSQEGPWLPGAPNCSESQEFHCVSHSSAKGCPPRFSSIVSITRERRIHREGSSGAVPEQCKFLSKSSQKGSAVREAPSCSESIGFHCFW